MWFFGIKTKHQGQLCIVPAHGSDFDKLNRLKYGEVRKWNSTQKRNSLHHRKFMGILRTVVNNSEKWVTIDQLLTSVKMHLGFVQLVEGFDGEIYPVPDSISFEKLGQEEFQDKVYNPSLPLLSKEMGISVLELESNLWENL